MAASPARLTFGEGDGLAAHDRGPRNQRVHHARRLGALGTGQSRERIEMEPYGRKQVADVVSPLGRRQRDLTARGKCEVGHFILRSGGACIGRPLVVCHRCTAPALDANTVWRSIG